MTEQKNVESPIIAQRNKILHTCAPVVRICIFASIPIALLIGALSYHFGYTHAQQLSMLAQQKNKKSSTITQNAVIKSTPEPTSSAQASAYTLSYITPSGWETMLWHPNPDYTENAILSPDYTSQADPNPQTGLVVLIYQFPGHFNNIKALRPVVEKTEDNLKTITHTTIGGYPTLHATYISTDSNRIIDDYNILKDADRWVVRIVIPGTSLPTALQEEQKYHYQISQLLYSVKFKTIKYL